MNLREFTEQITDNVQLFQQNHRVFIQQHKQARQPVPPALVEASFDVWLRRLVDYVNREPNQYFMKDRP
jgi:hypothetical protein